MDDQIDRDAVTEVRKSAPIPALIQGQAMLFAAMMMLAGIIWGLKLEFRIDSQDDLIRATERHVSENDKVINRGILPLTEERLTRLAAEVNRVEDDHRSMRLRIEKLELEYAKALIKQRKP